MTYHKVQRADGDGQAAAFCERSAAIEIRDTFNERYESDYEVVEDDDPLASEIGQATTIAALELGL